MASEKRLIDANALGIGKAKREAFDNPAYADGWNSAITIIENAPTVDAVEVAHGRWIKGENWSVTCSVCGCLSIAHDGKNFCPYCGAKMDGGNEDG